MSELLVLTVHRSIEKSKVVVEMVVTGQHTKIEMEYTYPCIVFSMRLRQTCTQILFGDKSKDCIHGIGRSKQSVRNIDTLIKPILLYGVEIWGKSCNTTAIEKIHLHALKRFLNVPIL